MGLGDEDPENIPKNNLRRCLGMSKGKIWKDDVL